MAGRMVDKKFLSPAYFQVSHGKGSVKAQLEGKKAKLLPPEQYRVKKSKDDPIKEKDSNAKTEVDSLKVETKRLEDQLILAKEREFQLEEESRRNRTMLQRSRVGDAIDLRRLSEVEQENTVLQCEARKQQAVFSKLRNDIKQSKEDYEKEMEKLETEAGNHVSLIRQLKKDLKENDLKYENDVESLQKRCRKQALSVKELKSDLHKAQEQIALDRVGFENVISNSESQKYQEMKKLEETFKNCDAKYTRELHDMRECLLEKDRVIDVVQTGLAGKDIEIKRVKEDMDRKEMEFVQKIKDYRNQIQQGQIHFEQTAKELKNDLEESVASHEVAMVNLKEKLREKDKQLKEGQVVVEQLRTYVGEHLPNIQLERLQNENKELKDNVYTLIKENDTMQSSAELLNIRLLSLSKILSIQEKELCKTHGEACTSANHENLLTKWRQKVFVLMVQMKSQYISHEKDRQQAKDMVKGLQYKLEASKKEQDVLSHTLTDRNAQLQIEANTTMSLKRELEEKKSKEKRLQFLVQSHEDAVQRLYDDSYHVKPLVEQLLDKMGDAFERLAILSQRINFAAGRVQFLQGLLARRDAHWKNELTEALKGKENENEKQESSKVENSKPYQQLLAEVEKLMRERDMLTMKATRDAELLESRVDAVRAEYDDKMGSSCSKMAQLQSELKDEKQRCAALIEKIETCDVELREARETIETIKTDLARHQTAAERNLDQALADERARFTEEFAKLEKQLNEVRREHTKGVVALRQAERQISREQEKAKEWIALQEKDFNSKMERCQAQIRNLEKERNMLVTTVRQEGLKVPRVRPKNYSSTPDESDVNSDEKENTEQLILATSRRGGKSTRNKNKGDRKGSSRNTGHVAVSRTDNPSLESNAASQLDANAMANVLKDLQSLSSALLTMDNEGSNE